MKYKIRLTRLIEEECDVYVDASCEAAAEDKALDLVDAVDEDGGISDLVWQRTDTEPHTYSVDMCLDASTMGQFEVGAMRRDEREGRS